MLFISRLLTHSLPTGCSEEPDFIAFYHDHKNDYASVDLKTLRQIKEVSRKEYKRGIEEEEERRDIDQNREVVDEKTSVTAWLRSLEVEP